MTQRPLSWTYFVGLGLFLVGLQIGIGLPDMDQKAPFLNHRSLITHGLLLPLLLFVVAQKFPDHIPRLFAIGVCLASTIHLCFDLFPRAWRGFALISVPFYGRTSVLFSWLWIGIGCLICLYIALFLIKSVFEIVMSALSLIATFSINSGGEPHPTLSLVALCIMISVAIALPSRAGLMIRQMRFKKS